MIETLVIFAAKYLDWLIFFIFLAQLVRATEKRENLRPFVHALLAMLVAAALVLVLKNHFGAPRPFVAEPARLALVAQVADGAFPSGHAAIFAALAVSVIFYSHARGFWYLIGALFIGLGRIAANLHWPSDVLVGWLLGLLAACLIYTLDYNRRNVGN